MPFRPSGFSLMLSGLLAATAPAQADEPDLVTLAQQAGTFETLATALTAAGLVDALQGEGPFTVFAPTDAAFAKLPDGTVESLLQPENREALERILLFHVVAGRIDAAAALQAGRADSLAGEPLSIRLVKGVLQIGEARVIDNDLSARNGIVHVIDSVLLPPPLPVATPAEQAIQLISEAVDRGVPLFNDGQVVACADIYQLAARALSGLGSESLPESAVEILRQALGRAERSKDVRTKAWILRGALDRALDRLRASVAEKRGTTAASSPSAKLLFDFDGDRVESRWFTLNDDVMGGVSKSGFRRTDAGTGLFEGQLSLENNGGFATIRTAGSGLGLEGQDALAIRVRGDGRTYALHAMPTDRRGGVNYWQKQFETVAGEWIEVVIPIDAMKRTIMGRRVPFSGPLAAEDIRSLAFMIADKNESPFQLEIDWIKSVRLVDGAS